MKQPLKNTRDMMIDICWKAGKDAELYARDEMIMHRYRRFLLGEDGIIYPGEGKEVKRGELLKFLEGLDQEDVRIMWVGAPEVPIEITYNEDHIIVVVWPRPYRY